MSWAEIIVAAASSTKGVVALAMLVIGAFAYKVVRSDDPWSLRLGVICLLMIGAGLAIVAVADKVPPKLDCKKPNLTNEEWAKCIAEAK